LISGWGDDSGQAEKHLYGTPGKNGRGMGGWAANHTRQPIKKPVKWAILAEKNRIQTLGLYPVGYPVTLLVL
jgi:hypothetical protein